MANPSFEPGDQVQLKSGGPVLTVHSVSQSGKVYCKWFAGAKLEEGYFSIDMLQVPEPKKGKS